jgi:single-stranded-DNA-specific exonuclease
LRVITRRIDGAAEARLIGAGVDPLLARIYAGRGIASMAQIARGVDALLHPDSLSHASDAARRLALAIEREEPILVIADYDCDGATACAVAVRGLRQLGAKVDFLVPNRFETGYGLTPEIVDIASARFAPKLIVTVDNGIASVAGAAHAAALGIDVVITDHHLPGPVLPRAVSIVNPNQEGCTFASKHLAGVGVMFYVLLALRARLRDEGRFFDRPEPRLDRLLDLVALGTVADVVRLDANNRVLVSEGLRRIRAQRMQPGVAALFRAAGCDARSARTSDLGFFIAPRLNAAGRLSDMSLGISCLITDDEDEANAMARRLSSINDERRAIEAQMQDEALAALEALGSVDRLAQKNAICIADERWHQGVVGILAGRLKERFNRPTLVFAPGKSDTLKGSGRSIEGIHLRDVLDAVSKRDPTLILQFGGHAMAAGLTIARARFDAFGAAFEDCVLRVMEPAFLARKLEVDGSLKGMALSCPLVREMQLGVWGQGFAAPQFVDRFRITSQRILKDRHSRLTLDFGEGEPLDAIWFNHAESLPSEATLVYRLECDSYNGRERLQVVVEHMIEGGARV